MIYELVLGNNLLHMQNIWTRSKGKTRGKFINKVCCATKSETEAEERFQHNKTKDDYKESETGEQDYEERRDHETKIHERHSPCQAPNCKGLDIRLIFVCRRIFNEAKIILYCKNVFSFDTPDTLLAYFSNLDQGSSRCLLDIRSLMKVIHISLQLEVFKYNRGRQLGPRDNQHRWTSVIASFVEMGKLPLISATCLIMNVSSICALEMRAYDPYWTPVERRDRAKILKEAILRPTAP